MRPWRHDVAWHCHACRSARKLVQGLNFHVMETKGPLMLMERWNRRGVYYLKIKTWFRLLHWRGQVEICRAKPAENFLIIQHFFYFLHSDHPLNPFFKMAAKKVKLIADRIHPSAVTQLAGRSTTWTRGRATTTSSPASRTSGVTRWGNMATWQHGYMATWQHGTRKYRPLIVRS